MLLVAALALAACGDADRPVQSDTIAKADEAIVALASSLPLYWAESADIAGLLDNEASPHWALAVLREAGDLHLLDALADEVDGNLPLPANALLVLAQPYPLSPQDNVALDTWVHAGGRVLLFADPMLTFESEFALGDRRRPQDIALLSPILTRWGLELRFDEAQRPGERLVSVDGTAVPVNLAGTFAIGDNRGHCLLIGGGLAAQCRIGKGRVLAFADAALLESREDGPNGERATAMRGLLHRLAGRERQPS
jgi:hypothetical protein